MESKILFVLDYFGKFMYFIFFSKIFLDQSDPNVEGVYEMQVTPLFRALSQIGCVCKVKYQLLMNSIFGKTMQNIR